MSVTNAGRRLPWNRAALISALWIFVSCCLGLGASACGGDEGGGAGDSTTSDGVQADATSETDLGGADVIETDAETAGETAGETLVLEFLTEAQVTAVEMHSYPLQLRAYRLPDYAAATEVAVTLQIEGAGDASLAPLELVTDEYGMAETVLDAGSGGHEYTVTASAPGATSASIDVTVVGLATGAIQVTLANDYSLEGGEQLTLWVVPGNYVCGETGPLEKPGATYRELVTDDLGSVLRVDELPEGPKWSIVGLVNAADGSPLAGGCVDGFAIYAGGEDTAVTLDLRLLDMAATQIYDFEITTSLAPWVDPALAEIPGKLEAHFTDPGLPQVFHDELFARLDAKVHTEHAGFKANPEACDVDAGCDSQDWCTTLMNDELDAVLAAHFGAFTNPWADFADLYDTATVLVSNTVLRGEVEITAHLYNPPEHYELELRPMELSFPDCGGATCTFSAEELSQVLFALPVEAADAEATIQDYNKLAVDAVSLALDPNRLVMLVLSDVFGPISLGDNALYEHFDAYFACQALSTSFSADFRTCIWSGAEEIALICDDIVEETNDPLRAWMNPLGSQREISLSQSLSGVDADGDLVMDEAAGDGTWTLEGGDTLTGAMTWTRP